MGSPGGEGPRSVTGFILAERGGAGDTLAALESNKTQAPVNPKLCILAGQRQDGRLSMQRTGGRPGLSQGGAEPQDRRKSHWKPRLEPEFCIPVLGFQTLGLMKGEFGEGHAGLAQTFPEGQKENSYLEAGCCDFVPSHSSGPEGPRVDFSAWGCARGGGLVSGDIY